MGLDWCLDNPCEAIDAPMIDTEDRAREIWEDYGKDQFNHDSFKEFWDWANPENRDEPVADCEACRVWEEYLYEDGSRGGSFLTQPCEWRGKRLRYTTLPDHLVNQSYADMTPGQMLDYSSDLRDYLDDLTDEAERETVEEAADWLEFWAKQGVSMTAWY
jgi:hypothetical protein